MTNLIIRQLRILLISAVLMAIAGCSTTQPMQIQVVYQCDRGSILDVTFIERSYSTIHGGKHSKRRHHKEFSASIVSKTGDQKISLPAEVVGSGFMYSDGRYTLRGKGNEATWSVGRMASEHCIAK